MRKADAVPIIARRLSFIVLKEFNEGVIAFKAAKFCDFLDGKRGGQKELADMIEAHANQVFFQGKSAVFYKHLGKIIGIIMKFLCDCNDGKRRIAVNADKFRNIVEQFAFYGATAELLQQKREQLTFDEIVFSGKRSEVVEFFEKDHGGGKIRRAKTAQPDPIEAVRVEMQPEKGTEVAFTETLMEGIRLQAEGVAFLQGVLAIGFLNKNFAFHDEDEFICGGCDFRMNPIGVAGKKPHIRKTDRGNLVESDHVGFLHHSSVFNIAENGCKRYNNNIEGGKRQGL